MIRGFACLSLIAMLACAPARPNSGAPTAPGSGEALAPAASKTITIGALDGVKTYGHLEYPGGGLASLTEIHSNGLVTNGVKGGLEPRLAATLPSFEDGTVALLPDGRMQTTWKLRPNIRWHDGVSFTAQDIAFSSAIRLDPDIVSPDGGNAFRFMESVEAIDPLAVLITWRTAYFKPLELPLAELWPYPRHLLEDAHRTGDKADFRNLPYFTTNYVHLGPFRLVEWGMGEEQVFERFDDFFLGRPKVDRIIIRTISDPNTLFANIQAGAVDLAPEKTLPTDLVVRLRDEWQQTGRGVVVQRQENWRYLLAQMNPDWARPVAISQDVRLRQALYEALDLEALRNFALPGIPNTEADSFMPASDPRAAAVGKPFARYRHNPGAAAQGLAAAGWRDSGGRLVDAAGDQVRFAVRGSPIDARELAVVAQFWRPLGIEMTEEVVPPARQQDREYRATFTAFEMQSREPGDKIVANFDSRRRPTRENSYTGSNPTSYVNPVMDRLIDTLSGTLDQDEQGRILREMGEILATDLPVLPTYFRVQMAMVTSGVRALTQDYPGTTLARGLARNAHSWERD